MGFITSISRFKSAYFFDIFSICIKWLFVKKQVKHCNFLSNGDFSNINFDKKEMLARINKRLREIDEEYRTTIVNMAKYKTVLPTTAIIQN